MTIPRPEQHSAQSDVYAGAQQVAGALIDHVHQLQARGDLAKETILPPTKDTLARMGLPECSFGDDLKPQAVCDGDKTIQKDWRGRITDVDTCTTSRHISYSILGDINEVVTTNKQTGEKTTLSCGIWDENFTKTDSKGHSVGMPYSATGMRVEADGTIVANHLFNETKWASDTTKLYLDGREITTVRGANEKVATVEKDPDGTIITTDRNGDVHTKTVDHMLIDRTKDNEKPSHMVCRRYHSDTEQNFTYDQQHNLIGIDTTWKETGAHTSLRKDSNGEWVTYDSHGQIEKKMKGTIDVSPNGDIAIRNSQTGEVRVEHPNGEVDVNEQAVQSHRHHR